MDGRWHARPRRRAALLCCALLAGLGCSTVRQAVPELEVERLLELRQQLELTQDQAAGLRTLLDDYRHSRHTLASHLALETWRLSELSASGTPVWSASYVTQVGLVHQLRAEQAELPLLLRDQARTLLTLEQRRFWDEDRLGETGR